MRQAFSIAASTQFSVRIQAPAGGWYSMNAFAFDANGAQINRADLAPFGVGEVFVTGGSIQLNQLWANDLTDGQLFECRTSD